MTPTKLIATAALSIALASGAFAKDHDQSGTDTPGENVGAETVTSAKTLGEARGNGKKPDATNGKSADAGKKD